MLIYKDDRSNDSLFFVTVGTLISTGFISQFLGFYNLMENHIVFKISLVGENVIPIIRSTTERGGGGFFFLKNFCWSRFFSLAFLFQFAFDATGLLKERGSCQIDYV